MKTRIGLIGINLMLGGIGMLFLSGALDQYSITVIGWVMIGVGIVGSLIGRAIQAKTESSPWELRPNDEFQKPTLDKGQLPLGCYSPGPK